LGLNEKLVEEKPCTQPRFLLILRRCLRYAVISLSLIVVVSFLTSHFLGVFLLLFTPEGLEAMGNYIHGIPVMVYTTPVIIPIEVTKGTLFLFLWVFQLLCFILAIKMRHGILDTIKNVMRGRVKSMFENNLLSAPFIANGTLLIVLAINALQESHGIPTGTLPEIDKYEFYFQLAYASVFEEFTFRVLFIGVFEAVMVSRVYSYVKRNERGPSGLWIFLKALAFPQRTKDELGLRRLLGKELMGLTYGEWFVLAISALMFGFAHVLSGIGWKIGKVTHATFVGIVLGLVYIKFGFQASVILHWFFNNYFEAYSMASEFIPRLSLLSDALEWLNTFLGVIFIAAVIGGLLFKATRSIMQEGTEASIETYLKQVL